MDVFGCRAVGRAIDPGRAGTAPLDPLPPVCAEDRSWAGFQDSLA